MKIVQEEIFGFVMSVFIWKDDDEVVWLVNVFVYGLGGGIWIVNFVCVYCMVCVLEIGMVWINCYYNFFGGMLIGGYK